MSRRYAALLPLIEWDFASSLRGADSIDVIGAAMAIRYRERYGVSSVVVHRGIAQPVRPHTARADATYVEIGVMGNTYGYRQLPSLARVVELVAARVGRRGKITLIGQGAGERLRADVAGRIDVDVTGHLEETTAIERLSRCFALFLNYPFSRRAAVLRQTSFPTKLSSYLLSARPLFVNAPADSSIADLTRLSGYAAWWGTERIEDGVAALLQLWAHAPAHGSQHVMAERLRLQHYDLDRNQAALFSALDALVPPLRSVPGPILAEIP